MITISNATKTACNSENITYKEYIVIDGTTVEIKGKMSNTAYKNTTFFGTFNLKMLEFTTENDIDYKKKTFAYWKSVNGEAFKIGTYFVTDIKESDTKEEVSITAMDYGLKFAIPYVSELEYESGLVTLKDVLDEICTNVGVTLNNGLITNGGFIVDSNQFVNGELCGDVVASIAGITGDFATINQNDELEFIFNTATDEIIEDYVELNDKRDTRPITVVVLGNKNITGQEAVRTWAEGVALYGENYLKINDNLFAYTLEKREALIDAIYNKVKGFGYSSFESKYAFKPYMQLGDLVQFKNKSGTLVNSIVLKIDTDYDDITLSAPSITSATINYETAPKPEEIAKRAEIIANQSTAQIISITRNINNINEDLNDTYTKEQTNTLIQNAENGLINVFSQSGGNNLLRNTAPYYMTNETEAEFWNGAVSQMQETDSASGYAMKLQGNSTSQNVTLSNGDYSVSFKYKRLLSTATLQVKYNGRTFNISDESGEIHTSGSVNAGSITIEIICNVNNGYELYDLMLKHGTEGTENMLVWTQNANESISDTIQISKGITASSSATNTKATMNSDGFRVVNKTTGDLSYRGTDTGIECNDLTSKGKSNVSGLLIQAVGDEIWISGGTM